jgi:hypothetical protein
MFNNLVSLGVLGLEAGLLKVIRPLEFLHTWKSLAVVVNETLGVGKAEQRGPSLTTLLILERVTIVVVRLHGLLWHAKVSLNPLNNVHFWVGSQFDSKLFEVDVFSIFSVNHLGVRQLPLSHVVDKDKKETRLVVTVGHGAHLRKLLVDKLLAQTFAIGYMVERQVFLQKFRHLLGGVTARRMRAKDKCNFLVNIEGLMSLLHAVHLNLTGTTLSHSVRHLMSNHGWGMRHPLACHFLSHLHGWGCHTGHGHAIRKVTVIRPNAARLF